MLSREDELIEQELIIAVRRERESCVEVLDKLAAFDARDIWERLGHANLFRYCVDALRYSPGQAKRRIQAARLADRLPEVREALVSGKTCLEAVNALAPVLNKSNVNQLLTAAQGKTVLEVHAMLSKTEGVRISLFLSPEALRSIEKVRGLMWHKNPAARIEDALEEAAEFYLDKRDPERRSLRIEATSRQPAPGRSLEPSRRIPQAIKDEVWHRDGGRCAYLKPDGDRCVEQKGLEYDHVVPFALGGPSNRAQNIRLLCWGHNQMEMRRRFGARA